MWKGYRFDSRETLCYDARGNGRETVLQSFGGTNW